MNIETGSEQHIYISPSVREAWRIYEQEIATYLRELPRLLAEGHEGRHALIKGDELIGIWDERSDASEAGRERYGLGPIFVQTIRAHDAERLALVKKQIPDFPG